MMIDSYIHFPLGKLKAYICPMPMDYDVCMYNQTHNVDMVILSYYMCKCLAPCQQIKLSVFVIPGDSLHV